MHEETSSEKQFQALDRRAITAVLHQVLEREEDEPLQWQARKIAHITGAATVGVYRLTGKGRDQYGERNWSLILKMLGRTPAGKIAAGGEQEHVLYWKREALVYQSELLNDLPGGLRGPRCYAITEPGDDSAWLWLEDVQDLYGARWPLAQYARAARCLGEMNGAYLAGRPLPTFPWLVRSGSPRGLLEHYGWMWKTVQDPATWQHPLLRATFPIPIAERLWRLWQDRHMLLNILERLPQTFCHMDAWHDNLIATPGTEGEHRLLAIDWAYAGLSTIATDIGDLMAPSFGLFKVEPCDPQTLDRTIFESYLEGLTVSGWQGNQRMVRCAFTLFTSLKYGCLLFWLHRIIDESQHASWEQRTNHPLDKCLQNQAALIYYLLDLVDEGRRLIEEV